MLCHCIDRLNKILNSQELKKHKIETLFIVHANHIERANLLKNKSEEVIDSKNIVIAEFGPVVGTHLGPGAFGVGFISSE